MNDHKDISGRISLAEHGTGDRDVPRPGFTQWLKQLGQFIKFLHGLNLPY
jgi:hypothetical protein